MWGSLKNRQLIWWFGILPFEKIWSHFLAMNVSQFSLLWPINISHNSIWHQCYQIWSLNLQYAFSCHSVNQFEIWVERTNWFYSNSIIWSTLCQKRVRSNLYLSWMRYFSDILYELLRWLHPPGAGTGGLISVSLMQVVTMLIVDKGKTEIMTRKRKI